jgi:hypothetical protein
MKSDPHEAESDLSVPIKPVGSVEEGVMVDVGEAVAKPVCLSDQPKRMALGSAKGEFVVPDDFNDPLSKEIEDLFW